MANGGLQYYFARLSVSEKLIAINVGVFILTGLATALLGVSPVKATYWFELPKYFFAFIGKPCTIITYSFFLAGI